MIIFIAIFAVDNLLSFTALEANLRRLVIRLFSKVSNRIRRSMRFFNITTCTCFSAKSVVLIIIGSNRHRYCVEITEFLSVAMFK